MITDLACRALVKEVELTPKPGLVDRDNNGSHNDMDIDTFYASAEAIRPYIQKFLNIYEFEKLRSMGKECEQAMFKATNGVNTHKGMIFSLAVICSAIGNSSGFDSLHYNIKILCKNLVESDLSSIDTIKTHGEEFYIKTNNGGIREEAESGYKTIFEKSLPYYEKQLAKYNEDTALKLTLLYLMSTTQDSALFARGGEEGMAFVKNESKKILHVDNLDNNIRKLDCMMIKRNLSAGGSADLLALTWFLHKVKIQKDWRDF